MALSISQKAGWGLADMGIVVFVIIKQLLIPSFLTNYLGVPIALAGMVTTSILVFDIFTDPVVGWLSDRTNTRWGRRAPWIVIGALIMVAGIIGLFAAPLGISPIAAAVWVGAFFLVATIGFTMVAIPYSATAGEMTESPSERSVMMAWRMGFASIGILIGGALIPVLAGDSREGFFSAALIVSPLILGSIRLSGFATRHAPGVLTPCAVSPFEIGRLVIRNKSFVVLTILYGVMTLAVALITAGLPFAAIYLILDDGATALSGITAGLGTLATMFAAFVVGSILSQAVWVWASKLLGKVIALAFGLMFYVLLLYALYLALPSVNVTAIAGMFVLAGAANGSYQQIPWAMYPDLMDVTRLQSGEAIEGAFSGIWLFGQKVANAFAPLLLSIFLASYGWRETTEGRVEQLPEAIAALLKSITLVPAAILVVAAFALILIYKPMAAKALR